MTMYAEHYERACRCRGATSTVPGVSIRTEPIDANHVRIIATLGPEPVCDACGQPWRRVAPVVESESLSRPETL